MLWQRGMINYIRTAVRVVQNLRMDALPVPLPYLGVPRRSELRDQRIQPLLRRRHVRRIQVVVLVYPHEDILS